MGLERRMASKAIKKGSDKLSVCRTLDLFGAGGRNRTDMTNGRGILNPVRLPISPLRQNEAFHMRKGSGCQHDCAEKTDW